MSHADALVEVLDIDGKPIGVKKRWEIDKNTDVYRCVYILLFQRNGSVVLSKIPVRTALPALYAGKFGVTAAIIQRKGESGLDAARRALKDELGMPNTTPRFEGEELVTLSDGRRNLVGFYTLRADAPAKYNRTDVGDLIVCGRGTLNMYVKHQPAAIAPSLVYIWQQYLSG